LVWFYPFICFERDPEESVHKAHLREMLESFADAFSLSGTFLAALESQGVGQSLAARSADGE
jgi:hypothetical protein